MANNFRVALLVLGVLSVFSCSDDPAGATNSAPGDAFALIGVSVIDGRGSEALVGHTVVVRNGLIESVSPDGTVNLDGVRGIKADGKFLIPGLWDLHAHTFADDTVFDLYLAAGVTGLRDMGCPVECTKKLAVHRKAYDDRPGTSPRILFSGPMLDGDSPYDDYPSHLQISIGTIPSAIALLKELDVDFVKVRDFLSVEEFHAIVAAADEAGLPVAGHIPISISAGDAVELGLQTAEHEGSLFGGLLLACSRDESQLREELIHYMNDAVSTGNVPELYAKALSADFLGRLLDSYDERKATNLVQSFVDAGAAVVPTLIVQDPQLRSPDPLFNGRRRTADPAMRLVPKDLLDSWRKTAGTLILGQEFSAEDHAAMERQYTRLVALVGQLHAAGVPVLAGTDAAFPDGTPWMWPGFSLHDELELLVNAGLTPAEAIAAATGNATHHLGINEVGTIQPGKAADMVLLFADPLADIRNTRQISEVIVNGVFVDRRALESRLAGLELSRNE